MKFINDAPFSEIFEDFYFNFKNPLGESEYVFISALDTAFASNAPIIVGELGFGVGRNFLLCAKKALKFNKRLHFVSIEKNPLSGDELAQIWAKFSELSSVSKILIKKLPPLTKGIHRINFSKKITLDLCIGEASELIGELDFKADAWFLDGFSPAKNETIWSKEIFAALTPLCKKGAILATYTSAGWVAKSLREAGFFVEKTDGFDTKRHMIRAKFLHEDDEVENFYFARKHPEILPIQFSNFADLSATHCLYDPNSYDEERAPQAQTPTAIVVGAGIAGLCTAFKLKKAGFSVSVIDKRSEAGLNGSGNFTGVCAPLITKEGVKLGEMHIHAFDLALSFYAKHAPKKLASLLGAQDFAYDSELLARYQSAGNPEIYEFKAHSKPYPSIMIKNAVLAHPHKLCKHFAKKLGVKFNHEMLNFKKQNEKFEVILKDRASLFCDILVLCAGSESEEFFGRGAVSQDAKFNLDPSVQISSVRGQTTLIRPLIKTKFPLSASGYICPAVGKKQLIGATYDRKCYHDEARAIDDVKNLESVGEFLSKKAKIIGSKVGYRGYSGDRFPLIGPVCEPETLARDFKDLPWSKNKKSARRAKFIPNLYLNTAHGAHGLSTAVLGAELICDYALSRPLCVPRSIANELMPSRFLIRKLKKGLIK